MPRGSESARFPSSLGVGTPVIGAKPRGRRRDLCDGRSRLMATDAPLPARAGACRSRAYLMARRHSRREARADHRRTANDGGDEGCRIPKSLPSLRCSPARASLSGGPVSSRSIVQSNGGDRQSGISPRAFLPICVATPSARGRREYSDAAVNDSRSRRATRCHDAATSGDP